MSCRTLDTKYISVRATYKFIVQIIHIKYPLITEIPNDNIHMGFVENFRAVSGIRRPKTHIQSCKYLPIMSLHIHMNTEQPR